MSAEASPLTPALINAMHRIKTIYLTALFIQCYVALAFIAVRTDHDMHGPVFKGSDTQDGTMAQSRQLHEQLLVGQGNGIVVRMRDLAGMTEAGTWRAVGSPNT